MTPASRRLEAVAIKGGFAMRGCTCGTVGFIVTLIFFSLCVISPISSAQPADKTIKIGVIGPMKFDFGGWPWRGAQMAADEINATGGVKVKGVPHKIELVQTDDNCLASVADATTAMEKLITVKKVNFVIGGYRSEAVLAQQEIAADYKTIFIGIGGGLHPALAARVAKNYDRYKYYFRGWSNSDLMSVSILAQTESVLRAIRSELGIKKPKIALLIDKALWAEPMVKEAQDVFPKMGADIVGVWRVAFTANNVTAELSAIKTSGAHMIFYGHAGPAGNVVALQWGELKIPAALVGINTEGMKEGHWKITKGLCEYSTNAPMVARVKITEKTIPFFDAYRKRYGEDPTVFSCLGHDNLFVLKEAIERAGTIESDVVVAELEKTDYISTLGRIAYNPRGHKDPHDLIWGPKHVPTVASQWRNGKLMVYWPDGHEISPALQALGAPSGWKGIKYEGTINYELPPWMVTYWKSNK